MHDEAGTHFVGMIDQTSSSKTKRRRRRRRKSSWTSRQPKKSSRIQRCDKNTTLARILSTQRAEAATIPLDRTEDSISPVETPSVVDPSSSNFIFSDLTAFTQIYHYLLSLIYIK